MLDRYLRFHWPIIGSPVKFSSNLCNSIKGYIIICPLTPKQMLRDPGLARKKIYLSAKFAEQLGAEVIGLGAFTSILTHDGKDLLGKIRCNITTGNTYAAVLAVQYIIWIVRIAGIDVKDIKVGIIGAAGSVGSGCAKFLAPKVKKLILIDINLKALEFLTQELKGDLIRSNDVSKVKEADFIVTATNTPGAVLMPQHISAGSVIIDASQPKNVSDEIIRKRQDALVISSGIAEIEGVNYDFDLGLRKNEVFACLGELLMYSSLGIKKDFLGKVESSDMELVLNYAQRVGFSPARFRNSERFLSESEIKIFTEEHLIKRLKHCDD
ncbi:MAG: hypothetical protein NC834_06890 [Candidatus Omnitrophica bacterium]|nr:hypothetical protein [Candidatus Omnitrophota bacterium]